MSFPRWQPMERYTPCHKCGSKKMPDIVNDKLVCPDCGEPLLKILPKRT